MRRPTGSEFEALFRHATRAWHLELRDTYRVVEEDEPFAKWRQGIPDDYAWREGWLSFVRGAAGGGTRIQRLRIVTEPLSDYMRWALEMDPANIAAGEEVRYLSRRATAGISLPAEDCWLFDDDNLLLSLFHPDGRGAGYAVVDDPRLVSAYRAVRDQLWPQATPYAQYRLASR
ncbi:DUF6879 family protein [Plantactinospora sp. CA-294935]|uniref:DUF6879 family protein n=1 Tax=Plantactinospora sp. CA-294935 TaxID=3240012 RepID=UPI003D931955